jgi:hypothetical protein
MTSRATLIGNQRFTTAQRGWRTSMTVVALVLMLPALTHAHGMTAEELGAPIVTSGLLAFVCYWLVLLWPSSKKKNGPASGAGQQYASAATHRRHAHQPSVRVKQRPRLRQIGRSGQVGRDQNSGRRAIDG